MVGQDAVADGDGFRRDELRKIGILQREARQAGQIERSGVIFLAVETVRIRVMRIFQTQNRRFFIHPRGKRGDAAGIGQRERNGGVVPGAEHQAIEQLAHRERFTGLEVHRRALDADGLRRNDDGSVEITRLADHQRRHDLGRAGDERLVLRMGRIEDAPCGCVQ